MVWRRDQKTGKPVATRPGAAVGRVQQPAASEQPAVRSFLRRRDAAVLDPAGFSWTALLEQHYPAIREEAERVLTVRAALPNFHDVAPDLIRVSRDGRSLVFDDTYEHEAWNDTDTDRVVLFLDIVRPLRPPVSWVNSMILAAVQRSPFVKAARAQHVQREAAFTAAWNRATDSPEPHRHVGHVTPRSKHV